MTLYQHEEMFSKASTPGYFQRAIWYDTTLAYMIADTNAIDKELQDLTSPTHFGISWLMALSRSAKIKLKAK